MENEIIDTGNSWQLSAYKRIFDVKSSETILFIHGFGCNKDSFLSAFSNESITKYNLILPDLLGHGDSRLKTAENGNLLANSARVLVDAMAVLGIDKYHVCAHSMGGLIGIMMHELSPGSISSFINLEGNLSKEDCFITGLITRYSRYDFQIKGRKIVEKQLAELAVENRSIGIYLDMFKTVPSKTLYDTARETVAISSEPGLFNRFIRIPCSAYFFGELNRGKYSSEEKLKAAGIPLYYVSGAGHSMQNDNPEALYEMVLMRIESAGG
ncbi:MAG: alpha/beta hydrolase [Candidatus Hodarchaeales archaeon]